MSARVVAFPCRQVSAHPAMPPPAPASGQVIRFPALSDSLTRPDIEALAAVTSGSKGAWHCETERDGNWGLSALVVPAGRPSGHDYAAFLVCRIDGRLHLVDARLSAHWRTLGVFDQIGDLAGALQQAIA